MKCTDCNGSKRYVSFFNKVSDCTRCGGNGLEKVETAVAATEGSNIKDGETVDSSVYAKVWLGDAIVTKHWYWGEVSGSWVMYSSEVSHLTAGNIFVPGSFPEPLNPPEARVSIGATTCLNWVNSSPEDLVPKEELDSALSARVWDGKDIYVRSFWQWLHTLWHLYPAGKLPYTLQKGCVFLPGNLPEPKSPPAEKSTLPRCNKVDW